VIFVTGRHQDPWETSIGGGAVVDVAEMSQEWERYGRTLVASMAEILGETDPENHPVVLETADYWLALGVTIGLSRPQEAAQLLELIEAYEENRMELAHDAREFCESVLR
jgi:hypothetical protein